MALLYIVIMPFRGVPRCIIFWTISDKIDHSGSESAYPNFSAWFVMAFLEPLWLSPFLAGILVIPSDLDNIDKIFLRKNASLKRNRKKTI